MGLKTSSVVISRHIDKLFTDDHKPDFQIGHPPAAQSNKTREITPKKAIEPNAKQARPRQNTPWSGWFLTSQVKKKVTQEQGSREGTKSGVDTEEKETVKKPNELDQGSEAPGGAADVLPPALDSRH